MTKEEYVKQHENIYEMDYSFNQYSDPLYDCPECGGGMCKNLMFVLASAPPQYEYKCNKCGHVEYMRY